MKPLFLTVTFFDPSSDRQFPVIAEEMDDIIVDIVPMLFGNVTGLHDPVRLQVMNRDKGIYVLHAVDFKPTDEFFLRVQFGKRMFSIPARRLVSLREASAATRPLLIPTRLPAWDSGWDNDYEENEFFDKGGLGVECSEQKPVELRVPLREFFNVGHRGAPYFFPENTIASFQKALHLGANGFEFDLCLTKDDHILVYHDSVQDMTALQRRWLEGLPYPVVSPEFEVVDDKMNVSIKTLRNGVYERSPWRPLKSPYEFDLINLTAAEVRSSYRYQHMDGIEHRIPELDEFLEFVSPVSDQVKFLFFDIKNPGSSSGDEKSHMKRFGELIGRALKKFHPLPKTMAICNVVPDCIDELRSGVRSVGEVRPAFAYDAGAALFKQNALKVANEKKTTVVSIGAAARPGDLDDVMDGVRCRDYPQEYPDITTKITTVVHWTLNDPKQILESFMTGVNGILTDKPDELKRIIEQRLKVVIG
jgi:glycerophosphoryl diester phosphodiesterase